MQSRSKHGLAPHFEEILTRCSKAEPLVYSALGSLLRVVDDEGSQTVPLDGRKACKCHQEKRLPQL